MRDPTSIFDNLDALRHEAERPKVQGKANNNRRARSGETFARIPHDRGLRLYGHVSGAAWVILIELDRLILTSKARNPIPLDHERLFGVGMTRSTIHKALRQLQKAKVVQVEYCAKHRQDDTLVAHLWYPRTG